jgi:hypothetical protein
MQGSFIFVLGVAEASDDTQIRHGGAS